MFSNNNNFAARRLMERGERGRATDDGDGATGTKMAQPQSDLHKTVRMMEAELG